MAGLALGSVGYTVAIQYSLLGTESALHTVLVGVATALSSAVIGKLIGVLLSQLRLRRLLVDGPSPRPSRKGTA